MESTQVEQVLKLLALSRNVRLGQKGMKPYITEGRCFIESVSDAPFNFLGHRKVDF
jgi:hypothetical protein